MNNIAKITRAYKFNIFFAVVRRRVGHGNHKRTKLHDANSKLLFKERQMKLEKFCVLENREVVPLLESTWNAC